MREKSTNLVFDVLLKRVGDRMQQRNKRAGRHRVIASAASGNKA